MSSSCQNSLCNDLLCEVQAFTKEAVHSYVPAINAVVERYARQWRATGRMAGWEESRRLAFDVAATTLLGFAFKVGRCRPHRPARSNGKTPAGV